MCLRSLYFPRQLLTEQGLADFVHFVYTKELEPSRGDLTINRAMDLAELSAFCAHQSGVTLGLRIFTHLVAEKIERLPGYSLEEVGPKLNRAYELAKAANTRELFGKVRGIYRREKSLLILRATKSL